MLLFWSQILKCQLLDMNLLLAKFYWHTLILAWQKLASDESSSNFVNLSKVITTFMAPPPSTTFLTVHPQDDNIIAIGMEDSSIQIYDTHNNEVSVIGQSLHPLLCMTSMNWLPVLWFSLEVTCTPPPLWNTMLLF